MKDVTNSSRTFHRFFTDFVWALVIMRVACVFEGPSRALMFNRNLAYMPLDSSNPRHAAMPRAISVSEVECNAEVATGRYADTGWKEFDEMASELDWRHSRLTAVLRWLRRESPIFVVESKMSRGVAKVRITKVTSDVKQARQLSTEIISQLAKLYSNLKHTDRNREKLAYEVKTIAGRIAPFLEDREFQIQYRRHKRQLNVPQQETQMQARVESDSLVAPNQPQLKPSASVLRLDGPRFSSLDRRALPRLILIASIIIGGLVITVFLTTTLLHAMELLSQYVERINSQSKL